MTLLAIMRRVHVEQLAGNAIGSLDDNFVIVEWTAEVGDHWIAPLHVHHEDDEAWYVLSGTLGFRLDERKSKHTPARPSSLDAARLIRWNAGPGEARYLLVMTPRIARLVEEIHSPGADVAAIFAAHKSLLIPGH